MPLQLLLVAQILEVLAEATATVAVAVAAEATTAAATGSSHTVCTCLAEDQTSTSAWAALEAQRMQPAEHHDRQPWFK
eukprot:gene14912-3885_t